MHDGAPIPAREMQEDEDVPLLAARGRTPGEDAVFGRTGGTGAGGAEQPRYERLL